MKGVPRAGRIDREERTIVTMIEMFCRGTHSRDARGCPDCLELKDYALSRLRKCPFHENKPICAKCRVHCYRPDMRERVRAIMRYSGPRMVYRHPIMAFRHIIDGRRKA